MKETKIANGIKSAHDRVAEIYGIVRINEAPEISGYNGWNFEHHVRKPILKIVNTYLDDGIILDAGCGNGQISQVYISIGKNKVIGADFSQNMLICALKRAAYRNYRDKFFPLRCDLNNLAHFKTSSLNAVHMFGVIEHLDAPEQVIPQFLRILKPGGFLIMSVPRKWSLCFFSYLIFGYSPITWGLKKKITDLLRFREKLRFYKFYTPSQIHGLFVGLSCELIEKIPVGRFHADGVPGLILHLLGKTGTASWKIFDFLESASKKLHIIPGGEYWIIRKNLNS